jgi:cobalt-zinc-cadmium efflux system protein
MSDHHDHHHHTGNIRAAFFLNLFFTIIEIVGGIFTNSVAILSDALHDLGDSISLGLSWYFQKLSQKKRDHRFTFGYKRFSIFGAIINSIVLVIGSLFIIIESFPRLLNPQQPNAEGMILLSILGILVNGAAFLKLKKGTSLNEKVVSLHLLEDVLGWVAVLIASIVMMYFDVPILDPLLSLLIAAYILFNVFKNLKSALKIILQAIPSNIDLGKIENKV